MQISEPGRQWIRGGLVLGSAACAVVSFSALMSGAGFFGQTDQEAFDQWRHRPLVVAAAIGVVGFLVAFGLAPSRDGSQPRDRIVAAVVGLTIATIGAGVVEVHLRSHPQGYERRALGRLAIPGALSTDLTTVGSNPQDDGLTAGTTADGPPVGVRAWGPTTCDALHEALSEWADSGSVWAPVPEAGSPPCYLAAKYHGWPVRAEIVDQHVSPVARVTLATPYG